MAPKRRRLGSRRSERRGKAPRVADTPGPAAPSPNPAVARARLARARHERTLVARLMAMRTWELPAEIMTPVVVLLLDRALQRDADFGRSVLELLERIAGFEASGGRGVLRAGDPETPALRKVLGGNEAVLSPRERAGIALLDLEALAARWRRDHKWRVRKDAVIMVEALLEDLAIHDRGTAADAVHIVWRYLFLAELALAEHPPAEAIEVLADAVLLARTPRARGRIIIAAALGIEDKDDVRRPFARVEALPPHLRFSPAD
jgi:hypothetical protein